ncbi:hypothetical protein Tco_1549657 [Tanacetum coccineum]
MKNNTMAVRDFRNLQRYETIRKTNHMKRENHSKEIKTTKMAKAKENALSVVIQIISSKKCPKLSRYQNQKAFVGGSWSDSDEDEDEKTNDEVKSVLWLLMSDDEVKRFYKPSLKPGVGFTKPTMRSKTPPPRRKENSHSHSKTPQPRRDQAVFTNEWDLGSLEYSQETEGPYSTDLPTPDDIRRLLELERVMIDRTIKSQTVTLTPNQILTKELSPDMKQWEELIRENEFGLG